MTTQHYELWGYPGAGKTTVASQVGRIVPIDFRRLEFEDLPQSDIAEVEAYKSLLKRCAGRQADLLSNGRESILLDEGVTHEIWRLLYRNPEFIGHDWWRKFLKQRDIRLIVLDVSPDCARRRIVSKEKKGPINQELSVAPLSSEPWQRAQGAYTAIAAEIRIQNPGAIFVDVSDQSAAESVKAVAQYIRLQARRTLAGRFRSFSFLKSDLLR